MKTKDTSTVLADRLLKWYEENARPLPWRQDACAYTIWVSEIMLQQTRVEAVKPYFDAFIETIPNMQQLAQTSDNKLTKLWEGLGYYSRVINMKRCAIECVNKYDGQLPKTYEKLLQLPGIGPYTAGAIASIAYNKRVAAVDGNVLRVFSRLLLLYDDISKQSTKQKFAQKIIKYIPENSSSQFNQAIMELGALICIPNGTLRCNICPLSHFCKAHQTNNAYQLPIKKKKKARRKEKKDLVILLNKDHIHLIKREQNEVLAGLYQFDLLANHHSKKALSEHFAHYEIKAFKTLSPHVHIFTHVEWHMKAYILEVNKRDKTLWCDLQTIQKTFAIPAAFKKYMKDITQYMEGRTS